MRPGRGRHLAQNVGVGFAMRVARAEHLPGNGWRNAGGVGPAFAGEDQPVVLGQGAGNGLGHGLPEQGTGPGANALPHFSPGATATPPGGAPRGFRLQAALSR